MACGLGLEGSGTFLGSTVFFVLGDVTDCTRPQLARLGDAGPEGHCVDCVAICQGLADISDGGSGSAREHTGHRAQQPGFSYRRQELEACCELDAGGCKGHMKGTWESMWCGGQSPGLGIRRPVWHLLRDAKTEQ